MAGNRTVFAAVVVTLAAVGVVAAALVAPAPPGPAAGSNSSPADAGADEPTPATGEREATGTDSQPSLVSADQPAWVRTDGTLRLNVSLEATDGGPRTVGFGVDADGDGTVDELLAEQRRSLDGPTRIGFAVPAGELPEGEHQYGVVVGETTMLLGSTAVVRGPAFRVGDAGRVVGVADRPANVSAPVRNAGDFGAKRTVRLLVDADGDGAFGDNGTLAVRSVTLGANETRRVTLTVPADALNPGTYGYRVAADTDAERATGAAVSNGTLVVREPARLAVDGVGGANVSRGTVANVAATVSNAGEVAGIRTVALVGPAGEARMQNLTLEPGANATVEFGVPTEQWPRGSYNWTLVTGGPGVAAVEDPATERAVPVRVREGRLAVSDLRGNETLIVGDPMVFAANVTNTGDATTTAPVSLRIDLDGDDRPEADGITQNVTLGPGEETAVRFEVPYLADPDPLNQVEDLPTGTYIYGVYTPDDSETSVFEARSRPTSYDPFGGSGGGDGGDDGDERPSRVTRDEISQEKYGLFFEELSGETRAQVEELYVRQPFAGDLGVTDVLTREEIARQEYGLDVGRGDNFELSAIDVDLQQRIEADFDAQFTRDEGDRVDSWDEISREEYGVGFDSLNTTRQEAVREAYREQFA
jgi:hypothetical protein